MRPTFVLMTAALILGLAPSAKAMNKAELIDAISSNSGLSKADAKRALEGFVTTTSGALKKGDKISLVGFGSFSISNQSPAPGVAARRGPAATPRPAPRSGSPPRRWCASRPGRRSPAP